MNNEEKAEILKSTEKLWNERNRLKGLEKENEQLKCDLYNTSANLERISIEYENLEKENARLKEELDSYKALDSHYDEIEEDAKKIAKENAELKAQIEKMKKFLPSYIVNKYFKEDNDENN